MVGRAVPIRSWQPHKLTCCDTPHEISSDDQKRLPDQTSHFRCISPCPITHRRHGGNINTSAIREVRRTCPPRASRRRLSIARSSRYMSRLGNMLTNCNRGKHISYQRGKVSNLANPFLAARPRSGRPSITETDRFYHCSAPPTPTLPSFKSKESTTRKTRTSTSESASHMYTALRKR